jgi:hypothetical protein
LPHTRQHGCIDILHCRNDPCLWARILQHVDACVARTWISYRCVLCHPWWIHRPSLVGKNNFFSFPVAVNNSIKVGSLVFLLKIFVITENIMKRHVFMVNIGMCDYNKNRLTFCM